jgi:hypothetical protein
LVVTVPVVEVDVVVGVVVVKVVVVGLAVPFGQSIPRVDLTSRQLLSVSFAPDRARDTLKTSLVSVAT